MRFQSNQSLSERLCSKSLEKFEEQKLVTRLDVDNPTFSLNQPLQSFKQQVEISGATAAKIANVVNGWLEENGKGNCLVNSMEINQVLIHISETALAQSK